VDADEDLSAAETQLLNAVRAGEPCYFIGKHSEPTAAEIVQWDAPDRTVRASLLRSIVLGEYPGLDATAIDLRGAIITGELNFEGKVLERAINVEHCRVDEAHFGGATFTAQASFIGTTFTRDTRFTGATFTGDAFFSGATFTGDAFFSGATFTSDARFTEATFTSDARFTRATFAGDARFLHATFAGNARFTGATFTGDARFLHATFAGNARAIRLTLPRARLFTVALDRAGDDASFGGATFTGDAEFDEAIFTGQARFDEAIFTSDARFTGATFTSDARFDGATFTGKASFNGATFTDDASFDGAFASYGSFYRAAFHRADLGKLFAETLKFDEVVFHTRVRLSVVASELSCRSVHLRSGGHLQVHAAEIDLTRAEFPGPTILVGDQGRDATPLITRTKQDLDAQTVDQMSPRDRARFEASKAAHDLAGRIADIPNRPASVGSLLHANVGELTLSGINLAHCRFEGAHGLDKLRLDARCNFSEPPNGWHWRRRPLRFTPRRVVAEECLWRRRHATWARETDHETEYKLRAVETARIYVNPQSGARVDAGDLPPALEIAGIYRDLRKGLEDIKNEPGAADFYYGEMEMRRLAAREPSARKNNQRPPLAERWLLHVYWAISGYGLRASRAVGALVVALAIATVVFANWGIASSPLPSTQVQGVNLSTGEITYRPPPRPDRDLGSALEFAARDSLFLLRTATPVPPLTTIGRVTEISLRLIAPLLLGLAILAVRGRTKR
jgi:hypothetical protein